MTGIDFKLVGVTMEQKKLFHLVPNKDPKNMKKLKKDSNRFAFMEEHDLESEDDLFQIEVDALEAIAPQQFKEMVLACVDEFLDDDIYQSNLENREITPTEDGFKEMSITKTRDLLASLESEGDEG